MADTQQIDEISLLRGSGLFDAHWYAGQNTDAAEFDDPIEHYVARGAGLGYAPHALFLDFWYRKENPDVARSGLTPLAHFLSVGEARGASPHPLFDPEWYRARQPSLKNLQPGLFLHFVTRGGFRGLSPHPAFDPQYYLRSRPDLATARVNPLVHFLTVGTVARYSPNACFDSAWYMSAYPDVVASGLNPLVHYLLYGADEGRKPHPDIDVPAYQASHADCPADPVAAYLHIVVQERPQVRLAAASGYMDRMRERIVRSGLFDPGAYLSHHADVRRTGAEPLEHLLAYGLAEGRHFTSAEAVARLIARIKNDAGDALAAPDMSAADARDALIARSARIGVYCNTQGNFFMQEIADLLIAGLCAQGIAALSRTEQADIDEAFDLRVFVAPHEFFFLGDGKRWREAAAAPNSVLYNVEQAQTQWFCRAFTLLLEAPLVIDINTQSCAILRQAGCNAVHFMPGFLAQSEFTTARLEMSDVPLVGGYEFASQRYDWRARDALADRPIDVLFVGSGSPRRDRALTRMRDLADDFRFVCVYTRQDEPLRAANYRSTSTAINCALGQRAKIVLNIHRDWLGYFEWSRLVLQGLWQGACVVTDPCLPNPVFNPAEHFLEEDTPHLGELIRWLLTTNDGRARLDAVRRAGHRRAQDEGSMARALQPVLRAFGDLLASPPSLRAPESNLHA